jgi:hypothetical protein
MQTGYESIVLPVEEYHALVTKLRDKEIECLYKADEIAEKRADLQRLRKLLIENNIEF